MAGKKDGGVVCSNPFDGGAGRLHQKVIRKNEVFIRN